MSLDLRITPIRNGYIAVPIPTGGLSWALTETIYAATPMELGAEIGKLVTAMALEDVV